MKWLVGVAAALIIIAVAVYALLRARSQAARNSKVVKFRAPRRGQRGASKPREQACSLCGKKGKKLAFYAAEAGRVIGVCPECKPKAERRELMRL